MPATAHQPDTEGEPRLAPVVSLVDRRGAKVMTTMTGPTTPTDVTNTELLEQATRHWVAQFKDAHLDLGDPATAAVVAVVTKELERIVGGLLVIREGRATLPPNPDAGVDLTSAMEVAGVLRDLAHAAESARVNHA